MTTTIWLRPANMSDADHLLSWRNDPLSRANSLSSDRIPRGAHITWLRKVLTDSDKRIFIAELNGTAVGALRAERQNEVWRFSWVVAPEFRGRGLLTPILRAGLAQVSGRIRAEIRKENILSQQGAARVGFVQTGEANGVSFWEADGSAAPVMSADT